MMGSGGLVAANEGANAIGRNQNNNYAPSPELIEALIASATRPLERLNDKQQAKIQELQNKLGVSDGVLHRVAVLLSEHLKTDNIDFEGIPQRFLEMLGQREALMAQQSALPLDPDEQFARMQKEIDAALASGNDELARQLLMRKRDGKLAAATRDRLDAASSEAALGDLARSRLEYLVAAEHFRVAAEILPPYASVRWHYLMRRAVALYMQGDEKGDNTALAQAIEVCRLVLLERPRESEPQDWAKTQNDLGNVLSSLGERENGTARLEQAVEAYHAALEERTRARAPLAWAMTQNNLGTALSRLGERESSTARFEQAVEAYRAALEERNRESVPLDWAATQNNLGNALLSLGQREIGTARLEQAVEAYCSALEERTRKRAPLAWAMTQNNLGAALSRLGERESGTTRLEQAVEAYRAALEERTRERVPLKWATTQNNLGNTLLNLGELENDAARLDEALQAVEGAWEVFKVAGMDQFNESFKARIAEIESVIAAVRQR